MRIMKKTIVKHMQIVAAAMLSLGLLSGCDGVEQAILYPITRLFGVPDGFTAEQARWIIIGEAILVGFLVILVILTNVLFFRYRKTKRSAAEERLKAHALLKENEVLDRLNKTKIEFFQNMSHDFKTPLAVISTSVINALDSLDNDMDIEEIRESLNLAQSEIMRMSRLVDSALKHAAFHGKQEGTEPVDLQLLIYRIEKTYSTFLEKHGNTMEVSIPVSLPKVYGNADTLLNVFSNLISNANRHTRNGEIVISAQEALSNMSPEEGKQYVIVTVSDTGAGIKPAVLSRIFNRGKSDTGSSGLGLSICKEAIETYGGSINVESEEGIGTKVFFTVPVYNKRNLDSEGY